MRQIEVKKCSPPHCPFRKYNDGGGHCDSWNYCNHPSIKGRHIKWDDLRTRGNHDIEYFDFPKWCPLKEEKRSSDEWQKQCKVTILDPDGWDRSSIEGYEYSWFEEEITRNEFEKRMYISTCQFPAGVLKDGETIWKK